MKKRVDYCDALRFFAIVSVIAIHVLADFRELYLYENTTYYFLLSILDSFTRAGVPLFFMFTGIFLLSSKKQEDYGKWVKKTIQKLVIPLIVVSFIYYLYNCWSQGTSFSFLQFGIGLYSNQIKYHLWYLYSIILIYLLIPFLKVGIQKLKQNDLKNLIILLFLLGSLTATISRVCSYLQVPTLDSWTYPTLFTYLNYVFLGYYLYHYQMDEKKKKVIYGLGILSLICMPVLDYVLIREIRWDPCFPPDIIFPFFMTMAVFIYVKEHYQKWKISPKLQQFFNTNASLSLYIYLSHVMILELLRRVIYHFIQPTRFIQNCFIIIVLFVLTYIITFGFSYLLQKAILFCKSKWKTRNFA